MLDVKPIKKRKTKATEKKKKKKVVEEKKEEILEKGNVDENVEMDAGEEEGLEEEVPEDLEDLSNLQDALIEKATGKPITMTN